MATLLPTSMAVMATLVGVTPLTVVELLLFREGVIGGDEQDETDFSRGAASGGPQRCCWLVGEIVSEGGDAVTGLFPADASVVMLVSLLGGNILLGSLAFLGRMFALESDGVVVEVPRRFILMLFVEPKFVP